MCKKIPKQQVPSFGIKKKEGMGAVGQKNTELLLGCLFEQWQIIIW